MVTPESTNGIIGFWIWRVTFDTNQCPLGVHTKLFKTIFNKVLNTISKKECKIKKNAISLSFFLNKNFLLISCYVMYFLNWETKMHQNMHEDELRILGIYQCKFYYIRFFDFENKRKIVYRAFLDWIIIVSKRVFVQDFLKIKRNISRTRVSESVRVSKCSFFLYFYI